MKALRAVATLSAIFALTGCKAPTSAAYDNGWGGTYHSGGYPLTAKP